MNLIDFGVLSLHFSFLLICGTILVCFVATGLLEKNNSPEKLEKLVLISSNLQKGSSILLLFSTLILLFFILSHDFSIVYVDSVSSRLLPVIYLISGLWGGQNGSLLFWSALLGLFVLSGRLMLKQFPPQLHIYYNFISSIIVGVFIFMNFKIASPFEIYNLEPPPDGAGLNPLLQNIYMVIHPPLLYLGFISHIVPWILGLLSFMIKDEDKADFNNIWKKSIYIAWFFLGLGNFSGMLWAYEVLGWGGYWGWDPVENSSLMPWLITTAAVHQFYKNSDKKIYTIILLSISFLLVIVGTYLTRSGTIASVHSFGVSPLKNYFILLMIIVILISCYFIYKNLKLKASSDGVSKNISFYDYLITVMILVLIAMTFVVFSITLFPVFSSIFSSNTIELSTNLYSKWMPPLALILLLIQIVYYYKKESCNIFIKMFFLIISMLSAVLITPSFSFGTLICFGGCSVILISLYSIIIRARTLNSFAHNLIHLSIGLLLIAFCGEGFKGEHEFNIGVGENVTIDNYKFTLKNIGDYDSIENRTVEASLELYDMKNKTARIYRPKIVSYYENMDQQLSRADISRSVFKDVFVALGGYDFEHQTVNIKFFVNPLTFWVWTGGVFLLFPLIIFMRLNYKSTIKYILISILIIVCGYLIGEKIIVLTLSAIVLIWFFATIYRTIIFTR